MNLAIFGDSFGVEQRQPDNVGWSALLADRFSVSNFCQSGVGEYKILQQILEHPVDNFNCIVVSHTSPYRVHAAINPLHSESATHANCDIIFTDIESRTDEFSVACQYYFKHVFDPKYYRDVHNLICQEIHRLTAGVKTLHITHFDYSDLYKFDNTLINFYNHWTDNRGSVNHYSSQGNHIVADQLIKQLYL